MTFPISSFVVTLIRFVKSAFPLAISVIELSRNLSGLRLYDMRAVQRIAATIRMRTSESPIDDVMRVMTPKNSSCGAMQNTVQEHFPPTGMYDATIILLRRGSWKILYALNPDIAAIIASFIAP